MHDAPLESRAPHESCMHQLDPVFAPVIERGAGRENVPVHLLHVRLRIPRRPVPPSPTPDPPFWWQKIGAKMTQNDGFDVKRTPRTAYSIHILTVTVMKYHVSVDCQESYIFPRGYIFPKRAALRENIITRENITILAPPTRDISSVPVNICYIRWSK